LTQKKRGNTLNLFKIDKQYKERIIGFLISNSVTFWAANETVQTGKETEGSVSYSTPL
jgi:hypothetical protein